MFLLPVATSQRGVTNAHTIKDDKWTVDTNAMDTIVGTTKVDPTARQELQTTCIDHMHKIDIK